MAAMRERTAQLRSGDVLPWAETGEAGGTPVVLVHAYVESWRYFEPLLTLLPPSVHACAPTQRGHPTVRGDVRRLRVTDLAADIVDFMDAVGLPRAVVLGASSGGLVAQVVATRHPDRVAGLVLVSSPVALAGKPAVAAMRPEILALSDPIDPGFVERFVRQTSPPGMSQDLVGRLVEESLAIPARVWREAFEGLLEDGLPVPLERIHAPTLLLSGSEDAIVRDDQQVLLDRIPDAELVVYDGVGHGPHLARPELVAADLVAFVTGPRGRPADHPS